MSQMDLEKSCDDVECLARFGEVDVIEESVAHAVPDMQIGPDTRLGEKAVRIDRRAQFGRARTRDEQGGRKTGQERRQFDSLRPPSAALAPTKPPPGRLIRTLPRLCFGTPPRGVTR